MIRLNRTTEYGLVAMRHMGLKANKTPNEVTSAREIADFYGFPFEITAKTLQRMKDTGLIRSAQGAKGGYLLQRSLGELTFGEFVELMEGPQGLVACAVDNPSRGDCEYSDNCGVRELLAGINGRVVAYMKSIRMSEFGEFLYAASVAKTKKEDASCAAGACAGDCASEDV